MKRKISSNVGSSSSSSRTTVTESIEMYAEEEYWNKRYSDKITHNWFV